MNVIQAEEIRPNCIIQLDNVLDTVNRHNAELDLIDNELNQHHKKIEELKEIINKYEHYFQLIVLIFTLFLLLIAFIINYIIKYEFSTQFNFILTAVSSFTICQLLNKFFLK